MPGTFRVGLIKTGSAPKIVQQKFGDLESICVAALTRVGLTPASSTVWDPRRSHLPLEEAEAWIILGSPASVADDSDWLPNLRQWIERQIRLRSPILGICYGFQLLAQIHGFKIAAHPEGWRIGSFLNTPTAPLRHDPLIGKLSIVRVFEIHKEAVLAPAPSGARGEILLQDHAGLPTAIRFSRRCWGVQFHPEMTAPIVSLYKKLRLGALDPKPLQQGISEPDLGDRVLRTFLDL